jgi:hypothetical protein
LWPVYGEKKKESEVVMKEHEGYPIDTAEEAPKNDDSDSSDREKKLRGEFRRVPGK